MSTDWTAAISTLQKSTYEQLASRGDKARLLNSPFDSLPRFPLLRSLHTQGINDFNVYPVDSKHEQIRFPVFIRSSAQYKGAFSDIINDAEKLKTELIRLANAGHNMHELIMVEYLETGKHDLYRKYAATRLGDRMIAGL